ncbi:hypothetical protein BHU72_13645 [Desulfuribacillus stibiiarsenatis]|uniref:Lipoprotein n=1 Tax=Desulfuribacillus stibiiarsenatis TaxID=1390249 RepID=A0A1E5L8H1_9FIRM|nr:hypothetical protein [Desulfuribacillus stibiiarsenatis]OEH86457.1 hypothetical protein BHU72_13645 [Desulfuribacillus stibiiarsenatis]
MRNILKNKTMVLVILVLPVLLLTACGGVLNTNTKTDPFQDVDNMGAVYALALDAYMEIDKHVNEGMQYIALDVVLPEITEEEEQYIKNHLKKYNAEIKEMTFEELVNQGLFSQETYSLEGVYLTLEEAEEIGENEWLIHGTKFRGGMEINPMEAKIKFENGQWKVISSEIKFI